VIRATAPVRICDLGGWTDTWFGGPGRVCNLAVAPGVEVTIKKSSGPEPVLLDVPDYGDRYGVEPGAERTVRHPLLEAAFDWWPPPDGLPIEASVHSAVPAGGGTGTSAAVAVALIGALWHLRSSKLSRLDIAAAAHRLEVDALGRESGVQDQLCSAFGGISYIEIAPYPESHRRELPLWDGLGRLLSLVFVGQPHDSSAVHRQVIDDASRLGPSVFEPLRAAARAGRDAVLARDIGAFGRCMIVNTDAQASLHPELIGADARKVIQAAARQGAIGWKVNGAGGDGGSVTLLSRTEDEKIRLEDTIGDLDPRYRLLPVALSPAGLEITESDG
jgi:D-glycero-alpha-D-manno-heptose-7-phosphate kinase